MKTDTTHVSRLRSDLEFSSQQHLGKNYVVVKDPITKRYFRFTEAQAVLLDLLREPSGIEGIAEAASEKLNGRLSVASVEGFMGSLEEKLLLDTELVREKLATVRSHTLEERNFLYWKLASLNPERIFDFLAPRTRWAFTRGFHIFAVLSILAGLTINYLHLRQLTVDVFDLFNLHGLLKIWLVTFVVITIHEFSHGLTCRHFGGKVHEVGFMLIYFQPAFYCDVSDSWMFPSKRSRMWVTFAGGYVQLAVWGVCTVLWRVTAPDTLINQLSLIVIVFGGLQTLINFNPLIKLDGYYMLSDYLEIPNLRAKGMATLWDWVGRREKASKSWKEQRAQLIYGGASVLFSTTLLLYIYAYLYTWTVSEFSFAGFVGFLVFSSITLKKTAAESVAGLRAAATRLAYRRLRNAGILLAALLVSFVAHWELKIPADFTVLARSERVVRAETGGIVVEMLVREGSQVSEGDVLARIRDFEKQRQVSERTGQLERKQGELALARAGARREEIDLKQRLVETKRIELSNARRNREQLNQLQQSLERKRAELRQDGQTLKRSEDLFAEGLIPRAELELAQTAVTVREREIGEIEASIGMVSESSDREADLKERELAEAESELRLMLAGNRPEVIRQLESEVESLEAQVASLALELEKTEIRAPIDGIVATPFVERKMNQSLDPGGELMRIVDTRSVTIEMQVPEKEMADVRTGNEVWMKVRSYPSMDFTGRVDFIAPVAQQVEGRQMVTVRTELANDELLLKPDMTGVAKIYCGDRRIIDLATRRFVRWIRAEFWYVLP